MKTYSYSFIIIFNFRFLSCLEFKSLCGVRWEYALFHSVAMPFLRAPHWAVASPLSSGCRPHHTYSWRGAASRLLQGFIGPFVQILPQPCWFYYNSFLESRSSRFSPLFFILKIGLATRGSLFLHTHFEMISSWNVDLDYIDYTDLFRDNWYKCYVRCTVLY